MTLANSIEQLQVRLGYSFINFQILEQALTHKSFVNENRFENLKDNERLEFLGDAVLDLALGALLMARFPNDDEGALSKRRASLVNEEKLKTISIELGVPELIRLGKGESQTGGREKPRILASTLEAILGALFLDAGFDKSTEVIEKLFGESMLQATQETHHYERDFKTRLQERCQKHYGKIPLYELLEAQGPEHEKEFRVQVLIEGRVIGEGRGRTKKIAEQNAAEKALEVVL